MNYNKYNLRELLQLALRVPEVGAVNFNILYYILKTIIEKEGLEEVKPVFSFDLVENAYDSTKPSIRRYSSAESLLSTKDGLKGKSDMYDEYHKESLRWDRIKVFKRLDGVEEEIDSIHDVLAQLDGKVSNMEKGFLLQETRLNNELSDFRQSVESKHEEYNALFENMKEVTSKVEGLMVRCSSKHKNMKEEMCELRQKYEEIATGIEVVAEQVSQMQYEKSLKDLSIKPDPSTVSSLKTDSHEKDKLMKKPSEPHIEDPKPGISNLITEEKPEKVSEKEVKKLSRHKEKEQEILSKFEVLNEEIFSIKEHLKSGIISHAPAEKDVSETERRITDLEDAQSKQEDIIKNINIQLLDLHKELNKLMEECNELDRSFHHDINQIKDKSFKLERTSNSYIEELEGMKMVMDGMVHNFDSMKENLTYMEKQIAMITELPGLKNRIEQLEEYVYSGSDQRSYADEIPAEDSGKKRLKLFKPTSEKAEKSPKHEVDESDKSKHFQIVSKSVRLAQDMQKKKKIPQLSKDLYKMPKNKDASHKEWEYYSPQKLEDFKADDFEEIKKVPSHPEVAKRDSHEQVKSVAFTSPELLEEHSLQLKTQVIIYVKEKLHDFEIELQIAERNIAAMKEKTDSLEKCCKDLEEKIIFMNANFSQRAGDLAALKNTAETHQSSIVSIMHHLERKAEAYAVNQKVSRKELAVIEDRVLKLCKTTSSEINKLTTCGNQKVCSM